MKIDPWSETQKKQENNEKNDAQASVRLIQIGPFLIQNGINKSWKSWSWTSMQKWDPKGRKGVENGAEMDPKPMKKSMQKSMPKTDRKNIEKTWKMEAPNLGNHCFLSLILVSFGGRRCPNMDPNMLPQISQNAPLGAQGAA